jgi:hypothetical protein
MIRPTAQPGSGWLTHSSGYSSNSSGPKDGNGKGSCRDSDIELPGTRVVTCETELAQFGLFNASVDREADAVIVGLVSFVILLTLTPEY